MAALETIVPRFTTHVGKISWQHVFAEWQIQMDDTTTTVKQLKNKWYKGLRPVQSLEEPLSSMELQPATSTAEAVSDDGADTQTATGPVTTVAIYDVSRSFGNLAVATVQPATLQQYSEALFKHTVDPNRQVWVLEPHHPLALSDAFIRCIVRNATTFAEHSGTADKRSNGKSMKSESGCKSSGQDQVGGHTLWAMTVGAGTHDERALAFDEYFDPSIAPTYHGTYGRPFLPTEAELRKGHSLLVGPEAVSELHQCMVEHVKEAAVTKRALNPVSAAEDEMATEPTFVQTSDANGFHELPINIAYLGQPG